MTSLAFTTSLNIGAAIGAGIAATYLLHIGLLRRRTDKANRVMDFHHRQLTKAIVDRNINLAHFHHEQAEAALRELERISQET